MVNEGGKGGNSWAKGGRGGKQGVEEVNIRCWRADEL